jgi:hypothetical protein
MGGAWTTADGTFLDCKPPCCRAALEERGTLTDLSLVSATHVRESLCWAGPHTVSSMVEVVAALLGLLSVSIFLAHAVAAYRAE